MTLHPFPCSRNWQFPVMFFCASFFLSASLPSSSSSIQSPSPGSYSKRKLESKSGEPTSLAFLSLQLWWRRREEKLLLTCRMWMHPRNKLSGKSKIVHMLLGRFLCLFTWLFVPIYPGYKNAFLAPFYFLPFLGPRLRATGIPRRGEGEGPPFHPLSLEFFPGVSFFAWGALPPSSQLLRALLLSKGAPKLGLLSFFPRTMKSLWQKLLDEWMEKGKESLFPSSVLAVIHQTKLWLIKLISSVYFASTPCVVFVFHKGFEDQVFVLPTKFVCLFQPSLFPVYAQKTLCFNRFSRLKQFEGKGGIKEIRTFITQSRSIVNFNINDIFSLFVPGTVSTLWFST